MSDPWKNRISLNPTSTILKDAGDHGGADLSGSVDSTGANKGMSGSSGLTAELKDVSVAKEKAAPTNPPPAWSA